jgi:DNA-nicking Smr family endonuclease
VEPDHALGRPAPAPARAGGCGAGAIATGQNETRACAPPAFAVTRQGAASEVARGSEPIEARIDLHGRTQDEAHAVLLRFLRQAQDDGAKFALVITGKGARARDEWSERGVLKRQVPLWLKLPEFRVYVVGFEPAHVGHGGEGALYVRIKKPGGRRRRTDS